MPRDAGLDAVFDGLHSVVAGPHVNDALGCIMAMAQERGRRLAVLSATQVMEALF